MPPLGLATQMRVFIDPDLLQYDEVWAAAGIGNDVFAINPALLVRTSGGNVVPLKREGKVSISNTHALRLTTCDSK